MSLQFFKFLKIIYKFFEEYMPLPNLPKRRRLSADYGYNEEAQSEMYRPDDRRAYFDYPGLVDYNVTNNEGVAAAEELMRILNESKQPVPVSLDTKYNLDFVDGPEYTSIISFCYDAQVCHLIQLTDLTTIPKLLVDCFHHPNVIFVGYCLDLQFKKLFMEHPHIDLDVILTKCVDLEQMANRLQPRKLKWGIPKLVYHFCNIKIRGHKDLIHVCWNEMPLPAHLQSRAAVDCQVGLMLYKRLKHVEEQQRLAVGENVPQ